LFKLFLLMSSAESSSSLCVRYNPDCREGDMKSPQASNFQDINIVQQIGQAKFPVYLASIPYCNQNYAFKLFTTEKGRVSPSFRNEARFTFLRHPNVIKAVHSQEMSSITVEGSERKFSFILMEYAPYGDFYDHIVKLGDNLDDVLIRTYFHSLVEGVEYLHSQGVCHMDLKPENLLVGDNYNLKIADFDMSFKSGDERILTRGTQSFRAPEMITHKCQNAVAADIYSMGAVLFAMKAGGIVAHTEDRVVEGINLFELLKNNTQEFFNKHGQIQGKDASFFDADFRELFLSMTMTNPKERANIKWIKSSKWYNGPVLSGLELKKTVRKILRSQN